MLRQLERQPPLAEVREGLSDADRSSACGAPLAVVGNHRVRACAHAVLSAEEVVPRADAPVVGGGGRRSGVLVGPAAAAFAVEERGRIRSAAREVIVI